MAMESQASSSGTEDFEAEYEALSTTVKEMFCDGGGYEFLWWGNIFLKLHVHSFTHLHNY